MLMARSIAVLLAALALAAAMESGVLARHPDAAKPHPALASTAATQPPDFNGDGFADLAIGVPSDRIGGIKAGAVNVIYGTAAGLSAQGNQLWSQGTPGVMGTAENKDRFGMSLSNGDYDGDGYSDLAIGVPYDLVNGVKAGAVQVLYGSADGLTADGNQLWNQSHTGIADAPEAGDNFGWSLTSADFDGDGYRDLAIGARAEGLSTIMGPLPRAGALHILYGTAHGLRAARSQFWTQDSVANGVPGAELEEFTRALAAGDFDGDGYADLAVGVPYKSYHDNRDGGVDVLYGSANGLRAAGSQFWSQDSPGIKDTAYLREQFGQSLAAGDFNHDGRSDLAVGVWFQDFCHICNQGALNVIYGSDAGLASAGNQFWTQDSPGILDAAEPFDRFSNAIGGGDFDGDGYVDLAVGAPREDLVGNHPVKSVWQNKGAINVIYGSAAGLASPRNQFWTQDSPDILDTADHGDMFGVELSSADFDGDGNSDLVAGVRFEDLGTAQDEDQGGVNVIYGHANVGLRSAGNQFWTQDSPGILGQAELHDGFGWSFSGEWSASETPGSNKAVR